MIDLSNKADCCGCRACEQICPRQCVHMRFDDCGFLYPKIDASVCIDCDLCNRVCPNLNYKTDESATRKVYAMSHRDMNIVMQSSSGGAWYGIYRWGIENGYKVYGVVFDNYFNVVYRGVTTIEECTDFRRSKYVQCNPKAIYHQIKEELQAGDKILFSGTPCFIRALKNYLRKEYSRHVTVDLICHGVTSPGVWNKYLSFIENHYRCKIAGINMRDKKYGWGHRSLTSLNFLNGRRVCDTPASNTYMLAFGKEIYYRPSCYECKFASTDRPGDITIADFWDIEKFTNRFSGIQGVSCVIVNTNRGDDIINQIKDAYIFEERKLEECLHPNLKHPTRKPPLTEQFWMDWIKMDGNFKLIARKYLGYSRLDIIKYIIRKYCNLNKK